MEYVVFSITDLIRNISIKAKNSMIGQNPNDFLKGKPQAVYIIIIILLKKISKQAKAKSKSNIILIISQWTFGNKINAPPRKRDQPLQ